VPNLPGSKALEGEGGTLHTLPLLSQALFKARRPRSHPRFVEARLRALLAEDPMRVRNFLRGISPRIHGTVRSSIRTVLSERKASGDGQIQE